jgi:hypothetical protein
MSLAQYLALGKSIKNVSGPGRYKLASGPVVPRFESQRRPGAAGRPGGPVMVDTIFDHSQPPVAGLEERPASPPSEAAMLPAEPSGAAATHPAPAPPSLPATGRWFLQTQPRGADAGALPRQGELALGLVQPVRNDLRESDLEVVPVTVPPPVTPPAKTPCWARVWAWLRRPWLRHRQPRSR